MVVAGISDEVALASAKSICLKMGEYFQVQVGAFLCSNVHFTFS